MMTSTTFLIMKKIFELQVSDSKTVKNILDQGLTGYAMANDHGRLYVVWLIGHGELVLKITPTLHDLEDS